MKFQISLIKHQTPCNNLAMSSYTRIESDIPLDNGSEATTASSNVTPQATPGARAQPEATMTMIDKLKQSSHPIALVFYLFFRISPIIIYIFGNFFLGLIIEKSRFILHFIILIVLIAADFWNLKNIAGRLLVGLRWWNETNPIPNKPGQFENIWVFETADPNRYISPIDSHVFWLLLYVQPVCWILLAFLALVKFQMLYLLLSCIAITLSLTNGMAFTKCDKFGKANNLATDIFSRTAGNVFSRFNPFS